MNNIRSIFYLIFLCVMIIIISSCRTTNKVTNNFNNNKKVNPFEANKAFYKEYSIKLGYQLMGNEDVDYIKQVHSWIGTPYKYGGCTREGIDCSCFVNTFYYEFFGISLKRRAEDMLNDIHVVDTTALQIGDIIFFKINGQKISHVGLYISNRRFIHASTSKGVMINSLDDAYYKKCFQRVGRVL